MAVECPGAGLAEPIGYSAADRAGLWRSARASRCGDSPERRPASRAADAPPRPSRAGAARHPLDRPARRPASDARDVQAEIASTIRAGEHIGALVPQLGADFLAHRRRRRRRASTHVPTEAPTFTHGDLKSDNVLAFGDQVRLLDLDRCGPADPALDLAKFVADLRWWCGAGRDRADALIDELPRRIRRVRRGPLGPRRAPHPAVPAQARRPPLRRARPGVGVRRSRPRRRRRARSGPGCVMGTITLDAATATSLAALDPSLASLPRALQTCSRRARGPARRPLDPGRRVPAGLRRRPTGHHELFAVEVSGDEWGRYGWRDDTALPSLARRGRSGRGRPPTRARARRAGRGVVEPVRYRPGSRCVLRYDVVGRVRDDRRSSPRRCSPTPTRGSPRSTPSSAVHDDSDRAGRRDGGLVARPARRGRAVDRRAGPPRPCWATPTSRRMPRSASATTWATCWPGSTTCRWSPDATWSADQQVITLADAMAAVECADPAIGHPAGRRARHPRRHDARARTTASWRTAPSEPVRSSSRRRAGRCCSTSTRSATATANETWAWRWPT